MAFVINTMYYGQCRCCLVAGNHRDITQEYYSDGIKEVYSDMFLDCFNVFMPTNINTCNLICVDCIERLRDASSFKKQVVETEQQLMEALLRDEEPMMLVNVPVPEHTLDSTIGFEIKLSNGSHAKPSKRSNEIPIAPKITVDGAKGLEYGVIKVRRVTSEAKKSMTSNEVASNIKIEGATSEDDEDGAAYEDEVDGATYEDEVDGANVTNMIEVAIEPKHEVVVGDDDESVQSVVPKIEIEDTEFEMLNEDVENAEVVLYPPEDIENVIDSPIPDVTKHKNVITEKMAHITNMSTILECSNITAFKSKTQSGFPCFYCRNIFENFTSLREHQSNDHLKSSLKRILKKYSAESLVVYADVTDLKCTLCNLDIPNLKELKSHLVSNHNKRLYNKCTDRVIPFKLTENYYECQICNFYFETFGAIERHMNTHIRNYVCDKCGAGFITMLRLKTHVHSIHKEGKYPCNLCDKMFTTVQRYKGHVDFVHKMLKKLKCSKCLERFSDYFVQQKHLVEVHGEKPIVYRCNVCSKAFNRRYTLSCHMKRRHLEQRDVCCQYCLYTCYNKTELREHMLKHNGVKTFECNVCKKTYSRKKSLKEHMRLHFGQRFRCKFCDQAFVHNSSMKLHMKIKHVEYQVDE